MGKRRTMKTRRERKSRIRATHSINNSNSSSSIVKIASEEQPTYFCSADLIGSNEYLLRNILINIPHRPISRFKSVSKLWLSIISDPDFSSIWYTKHIPSPSALLFYIDCFSYKFIPLDEREKNLHRPNFNPDFECDFNSEYFFYQSSYRTRVLQSCNGLLLLGLDSYFCRTSIAVYNPTTNQLKLIPEHPKNYFYASYNEKCKSRLAFDPELSPHYKIFSVLEKVLEKECSRSTFFCNCEILIYLSESDSWRVLSGYEDSSFDNIKYDVMYEAGVYWNGAIHWPYKSNSSLSFNVDEECCLTTPIIPPIQGVYEWRNSIRYFGKSSGHLHLIAYENDYALQFDVLEMEKDYSNWFVKYHVDLTFLGWRINAQNWCIQKYTILSLIVNRDEAEGEEESPVLVLHSSRDKLVVSYNLNNEELKDLCSLSLQRSDNWSKVFQFIRTPIKL